ncbi:MAG: hypothetical protein EOO29_36420 [Comamonadaceae bacterium]|nr:MAG: hypothetical protein EOO29_36420 [Comamonadaceae bacterium]
MPDPLNNLLRALQRKLAAPQLAVLKARVARLEQALAESRAKNQELARQLNEQREKTRELYAKTKDYAARLNARR